MLRTWMGAAHVYLRHRLPATLALVDQGGWVPLPSDTEARLDAAVRELVSRGFLPITTMGPGRGPGPAPWPSATYVRVLVDRRSSTIAWVIDVQTAAPHELIVDTCVELIRRWDDGTIVSALNARSPVLFEPVPGITCRRRPGATLTELMDVHRAACDEERAAGPLGVEDVDHLAEAERCHTRVLEHQVRQRLLRRRDEGFGYTARGAVRVTRRVVSAQSQGGRSG